MYLRILLPAIIISYLFISGCDKNNPVDTPPASESEALVKYLEANGDYINTLAPAMISSEEIRNGQLNRVKQVVLDTRIGCDFSSKGHIEGAIQIQPKDIPWYYRNNNLDKMERVIITCETGQKASYTAALLRLYGYKNLYAMVFGMSGWNSLCDSWTTNLSDAKAALFETTEHSRRSIGSLPVISTGKSGAEEILTARVTKVLEDGFDSTFISSNDVFNNLSSYYIIFCGSYEQYISGHIPNTINYVLGQDFKLGTYLKTLPTDKQIIVYCATGQTSAQVASFLRVMGYNARSVLFGNNGMNYSSMQGKKFTPADIHNYPVIF
jgi:rhodanese-related sulfurtransferase